MSEAVDTVETTEELEAQLPVPVGPTGCWLHYRRSKKPFDGTDLLKTDTTKSQEYVMSIIGLVMDMGEQAYNDAERFPTGPWCKQGDYVMFPC